MGSNCDDASDVGDASFDICANSLRLAHQLIHDPSDPIPHFRVGAKLVRVKRSDLHEWMEKRRADESRVDRIVQEVLG